jgi:23S rRNA (cytidine1920-2'-O)/16S rRNA (cytidine1409-2'-O)-methyltransferase
VETRQQAQSAVTARRVLVGGTVADKPSRLVSPAEPVVVSGPGPRFVSRGGEKLDAALERFGVDATGARVVDAGASTGGFTDCLLDRGAAHVFAVDVGHGQLHPRLRHDPRVTVLERTDIRQLSSETLIDRHGVFRPVDLVTADLSFISLTRVLPVLTGHLVQSGSPMLLLVKPQFEAGRPEVSRGKGVIRDPQVWRQALETVTSALVSGGTGIMGAMASPLSGAAGNTEFFLHARTGGPVLSAERLAELLDETVAAVTASRPG